MYDIVTIVVEGYISKLFSNTLTYLAKYITKLQWKSPNFEYFQSYPRHGQGILSQVWQQESGQGDRDRWRGRDPQIPPVPEETTQRQRPEGMCAHQKKTRPKVPLT